MKPGQIICASFVVACLFFSAVAFVSESPEKNILAMGAWMYFWGALMGYACGSTDARKEICHDPR